MRRSSTALQLSMFIISFDLLCACGGSDFAGGGSSAPNPGKANNPDGSGDATSGFTLNWSMSCDNAPSKLTKAETGYDLAGVGPHRIPHKRCRWRAYPAAWICLAAPIKFRATSSLSSTSRDRWVNRRA